MKAEHSRMVSWKLTENLELLIEFRSLDSLPP